MSKSPQRKTIHNIITNIRQMASNLSKDVSNAQLIILPTPQPKQKQHQESSIAKSTQSDSIQIRLAKSARLTMSSESTPSLDNLPSPDLHEIAQGIQKAHVKVDEALRFVTNMKHKLDSEPKNEAVTSNKQGVVKVKSLVDQSKLASYNTQPLMSVPDLHGPQETPSLGVLPLTLEDLKTTPISTTGVAAPYFGHADVQHFNPFSKSVTHKSSQAFAGITTQNNPTFIMSTMSSNVNLPSSVPSLNLGTNPNFIQMMRNQTDNNIKISPAYTPSTLPSSIHYQQPSACDHHRLNNIISSIKQRDHSLPGQPRITPHQPQSLNDLQYSSVNSLTSIHEQLARPNTVSHLSKPPLRSNWFNPTNPINETNFYQIPPQSNSVSHYASQNSLHQVRNRHIPNMTATIVPTTSYQQPPMYVNSYMGGQRPVGSFHPEYNEEQFDGEEGFRPRRLTFEDPRSKKNSPYIHEVKQRRPVQGESQFKVQKTARRRSDVRQKRSNMCEDLANDEDSMNKQCCCEHHHQCHNRKTSRYSEYGMNPRENSVASQSEEESFEESIEYEQTKPRKVKEQLCSNCQCQRPTAQQTYVTHHDVGSGKVCGSQRRSISRKQHSMVVHNEVANNKIQVHEPEEMEHQSQVIRRNKSIDNTQPKPNVRRKTQIAVVKPRKNEKLQNNENIADENSQQSEKKQRISFEVLRKKDENQSVLQRRSIQVNTKKISEKRDSKNSLYDKEFVDQLAIDFPAMGEKAREQTEFKTVAAQKTEIVLGGIKKPRRVPM